MSFETFVWRISIRRFALLGTETLQNVRITCCDVVDECKKLRDVKQYNAKASEQTMCSLPHRHA